MNCDICGNPVTDQEATIVSPTQIRGAVNGGWTPPNDDPIAKMARSIGLSDDDINAEFIAKVRTDNSNWAFCNTCYATYPSSS